MTARKPKPLDVDMWAAIAPAGWVDVFSRRRDAIFGATRCHAGGATWAQAKAAGWRVVKVRVREVRR